MLKIFGMSKLNLAVWDNTTSDTKFDPGTAGLDVLLSETG